MGRSPCCPKEGLSRGAWTAMEDKILKEYIKIHGEGKWRHLPKRAGLKRCGKSCRLRWLNYLRPGIKRGNITNDEEELIIRLHNLLGNRWSLIAGRLPGRTDNEIKNYWNTNIGRKLQNGTPNCSNKSASPCSLNSLQQEHYPYPQNKDNSRVVQTKATNWTQVTITEEIAQQNERNIEINDINDDKMKGMPSSETNIDTFDFMADFEMGGNFFPELLDMDFPESSFWENKIMEDNGNLSTVDKGQSSSPKSSNDNHFPWGDSLYTDFDLPPMATFMESGFDWL